MRIAARLRLLVVTIVTITALLIGGIVFYGYASFSVQQRREALSLRSVAEAQLLEEALTSVRQDTAMLVRLPLLDQLSSRSSEVRRDAREPVAQIFASLLRTHQLYSQVRYIAADKGMEVVRVERAGNEVVMVPPQLLQSKSDRDYVQLAVRMDAGSVFLHSPTLNRENGVIEVPHRPMLRATGTHAGRDASIQGIVVINVELQALFEDFYGRQEEGCGYYVASQSGDYLLHPDSGKTFGFELGKSYLVGDEFPLTPAWLGSAHEEERIVESARGDVVDFRKVFLDAKRERFLLFGAGLAVEDTNTQSLRIGALAITITAALAIMALLLAYLVAARTVRPVEKITKIAEQIANGEESESLPVERSDEVGTLARTFAHMLERLQAKEKKVLAINEQLTQANEDMEHFAQIASHDLREPARRVATMADFLMTDEIRNLSEEGKATLETLVSAASRLLDQITDIRSLTQVGQGRLLRENFDLSQEICSILLDYEPRLIESRATSQVSELPQVNVYASLVRLLYAKLVDNALTHAKVKGFRLDFTGEQVDGVWTWGVRNTGSSIPAEQLHRVFLPFAILEQDLLRAGMGLSICKRIVERHSGKIWLESGADHVHVKFTLGNTHVS